MRLLVLGINYWPEESGNAVFTVRRCEYLARRGHEVIVCTGFPYYPEWRIGEKYRGKLYHREVHNGVTILRSYVYVRQNIKPLGRIFHEASFIASSLVRALGNRKPDLIFVVSAPLGLGLTAYLLGRVWRRPFVFYVSDMQPDAAVELGMLRPGAVVNALYRLERFAYRHASLIGTLTEGMRQRIASKSVPAERIVLFEHCADSDLFGVPLTGGGASFRHKHGLGDRFTVLHSGNMGVKQGLGVLLEAAALRGVNEDVEYVLAGDGAARPVLQDQAVRYRLSNLHFLPLQPKADFLEMLGAADLAVITQQRTVSDVLFPGKTVALLSAGCPVVASVDDRTEAARVITESAGGIVVEPENPKALADGIKNLRVDSLRHAMAEAGRRYARHRWDAERILPTFEGHLENVAIRGGVNGR